MSQNVIIVNLSRRLCNTHGGDKNANRNFVRKLEGKHKHLGKGASRREDNIKMYLKGEGLEDLD
jgi:hypothetical protein